MMVVMMEMMMMMIDTIEDEDNDEEDINLSIFFSSFSVDSFLHCITTWLPTIAHFIHFKQKNNVHGNLCVLTSYNHSSK